MIVLEVRCRRSKGQGRACRNLLGFVELHDGELRILYNDGEPGFINQCSQASHVSDNNRPLDVTRYTGTEEIAFMSTPGAKIPADWALDTERKRLLDAARAALAESGKFPRDILY